MSYNKKLLEEDSLCQFTSILGFLASEDTSSAALLTKKEQRYYFIAQNPFGFVPTFLTEIWKMICVLYVVDCNKI